jgi:hypothetical protein
MQICTNITVVTELATAASEPLSPGQSLVTQWLESHPQRERWASLPPNVRTRADQLLALTGEKLRRHAGSATGEHDRDGDRITVELYPRLSCLLSQARILMETTLRLGKPAHAKASQSKQARSLGDEEKRLPYWNSLASLFEGHLQAFQPDDPFVVASKKATQRRVRELGEHLREPTCITATEGAAEPAEIMDIRRRLKELDDDAHRAAVQSLGPLLAQVTVQPGAPIPETVRQSYASKLLSEQFGRNSQRRNLEKILEELRAPEIERAALRFSRCHWNLEDLLRDIARQRRRRSKRKRRDQIQRLLAGRGHGERLRGSLPRFEKSIRLELATLAGIARRHMWTRLFDLADTDLPKLTLDNSDDVLTYLKLVAAVYDQASLCFHQDNAPRVRSGDVAFQTPAPRFCDVDPDFHRTFPRPVGILGPRQVQSRTLPESTTSFEERWVSALHRLWEGDIKSYDTSLRRARAGIAYGVNPETGRRVANREKLEKRLNRQISKAQHAIKVALEKYGRRFGAEAERMFRTHMQVSEIETEPCP